MCIYVRMAGHVSALCAALDTAQKVSVVLDKRIVDSKEEVSFHPFTNTASTAVAPADLVKVLHSTGHKVHVVDFANETMTVL